MISEDRTLRIWDTFYVVVYLVAIVGVWLQDGESAGAKAAASALLLAAAGWYGVFGRAAVAEHRSSWRSWACVAGVLVSFIGAHLLVGSAAWCTPAVISQTFWLLPLGFATPVVVLVSFVPALASLARGADPAVVLREALPSGVIFCALAVLLGVFINRVTAANFEQAALIRQLEDSQAEVGRLSHEAGTAAERERLAREIHDTLAQGFTSIITLTQAIESEMDGDPAAARRHLALTARTARENLDEARAMVAALSPSALVTGLEDAVRRLVGQLAEETGLTAGVEVSGPLPTLSTPTEVVLLRAVQESLTNVRRHADAANVVVLLSAAGPRIRMIVRDDGRGFVGAEGFGLRGMRARAEQIGGEMNVRSGRTGGTSVELEVPA